MVYLVILGLMAVSVVLWREVAKLRARVDDLEGTCRALCPVDRSQALRLRRARVGAGAAVVVRMHPPLQSTGKRLLAFSRSLRTRHTRAPVASENPRLVGFEDCFGRRADLGRAE